MLETNEIYLRDHHTRIYLLSFNNLRILINIFINIIFVGSASHAHKPTWVPSLVVQESFPDTSWTLSSLYR